VLRNAKGDETLGGYLWDRITGKLKFWDGTEEVAGGADAWTLQELSKGCPSLLSGAPFANCSGGWAHNNHSRDLEKIGWLSPMSGKYSVMTHTQATQARDNGELTDDHLAQFGFFRKFSEYQERGFFPLKYNQVYQDLYAPIGPDSTKYLSSPGSVQSLIQRANELAGQPLVQWDLLASAIPATSFAAGANEVGLTTRERNYNMQQERRDLGLPWPASRMDLPGVGSKWLHSDFRNVALPYVFPVYEKMIEISSSKEQ